MKTRTAIDTPSAGARESRLRMLPAGSARFKNAEETEAIVRPRVWWLIWLGSLTVAGVVYLILSPVDHPTAHDAEDILRELLPVLPLALSVLMRWVALPLCLGRRAGFAVYVAGLALGETTTILAAVFGGGLSRQLFSAGVLAILQFVPLFLPRLRSSS